MLNDDDNEVTTRTTDAKPHETSLAIWDIRSPLIVNCQWKLKIGAKCMGGCELAGQEVGVHNEAEEIIALGKLGTTPWPRTTGLYWTEVALTAPERKGTHLWIIRLSANLEHPHTQATSNLSFVAAGSPEHSVAIEIVQKHTESRIGGAEIRLGIYRASTNEQGLATVHVSKGRYDLNAWKAGYELASRSLEVGENLTVRLELSPGVEPEESYWM